MIDFERIEIMKIMRRTLMSMSSNRKRKRLNEMKFDDENNMMNKMKKTRAIELLDDISATRRMFISIIV